MLRFFWRDCRFKPTGLLSLYHRNPLPAHYLPNYFQRFLAALFGVIGNGLMLASLPVAQEVGGSRPLSRPNFEPKTPESQQLTGFPP